MYRQGDQQNIAGVACATVVVADVVALQSSFVSGGENLEVYLFTLAVVLIPLYLARKMKIP